MYRAAIANIYEVDPLPCVNTKFRLHYLFIEPYARTFPCTNRYTALFVRTLPSIPSPDQRLQRAPTCIGYGVAGLGDVEVSFQCLVSFFCLGRAARSSFRKPGLFRPKFQKPKLPRPGPAEGEAALAAPLRTLKRPSSSPHQHRGAARR